jgi:predicted FMN-binding regulatory protein PaiB
MYVPPQFEGDAAQAVTLMREHPFASLISLDATGLPYITHLPLHLEVHPERTLLLGQSTLVLFASQATGGRDLPRPACLHVAEGLS